MSLVGDIAGAFGAEKAEDKQFAASQAAMAAQREATQKATAQYQPYADFGAGGMGLLSRLYGLNGQPTDMSAFTASPGYQFRLQQGQDTIESGAAARGGLYSGATAKALSDYGQQSASQEFDNYVNRLFGVTGVGQDASTGIANAQLGLGRSLASEHQNIGNNQANAIGDQWKAWGSMGDQGVAALMGGFGGVPGAAGGAGAGAAGAAGGAGAGGFNLSKAAMMLFGG